MSRRFVFGKGSKPLPDVDKPLPPPPPLPPLAEPPAWWTGDLESDRNAAARGCQIPNSNCSECRLRCPMALRLCNTCRHFDSADGLTGTCSPTGSAVKGDGGCFVRWGARK